MNKEKEFYDVFNAIVNAYGSCYARSNPRPDIFFNDISNIYKFVESLTNTDKIDMGFKGNEAQPIAKSIKEKK